jgi:hypothetical protein
MSGRLIDAEKLKKHYAWWEDDERRTLFDQIVDAQPTVEAEPVRHGKWIDRTIKVSAELTNIIHVCSVCEEMAVGKYRYCPHCGARMDKDDQVN